MRPADRRPDPAARDRAPADRRSRPAAPGSRRPMPGRNPPAAPPGPSIPGRPMPPGAPTDRVIRPPSGNQKSRPPGRRPGPDGPKAWAMFQTNNTAVFRIGSNCPILALKVAYIFLRGPYAETHRPICRGAMLIIRRFNSPRATRSSFSAMILWCRPAIKSGQTRFTKVKKSSRHFSLASN